MKIYKITNPKRRVYIGQSTNIKSRFRCYRKLLCKEQPKLYNSLLKYGIDKHTFEIICECEQHEADSLEIYYIALYNSITNGLNSKIGGHRAPLSEESRKKLSNSLTIAAKNPITKERRSAWQRGRKMSPEAKQKMRERRLGKTGHPNQIKAATGNNNACKGSILAYKDGQLVAQFKNSMEAARILGGCQQNINKVIAGERPLAMGYFFKRVA